MTSSPIRLYNTMVRAKVPLKTEHADRVTLYVCGPTVYNYAHIGNARAAAVFDVLFRVLRQYYPKVVYARNFTDVDDKINAAATEAGVPIDTITARYIDAYHADMQALGILTPDLEPRVTTHIPAIIALIEMLLARQHAYVARGHVLFDVASYPEYGRLSGRHPEDMMVGARVEVAPYKRNPLDFVLWKPSIATQPGWHSPWGRGRPGWHVECSAMIGQHLGTTIDIHGGGQDLIFPHHENEIAQGACAHGALYCRTWVHNGFVTVNGQKMSKSLGNVLLVRDLLKLAPGEAIRLALLSAHYRHPLNWTADRITQACRTLYRFYRALNGVAGLEAAADVDPDEGVVAALANDLDTCGALARLHKLASELEHAQSDGARRHLKARFLASGALLGLLNQNAEQAMVSMKGFDTHAVTNSVDAGWVEQVLAERAQARAARDFVRADSLRCTLENAGVVLKDTAKGTAWHLASTVRA